MSFLREIGHFSKQIETFQVNLNTFQFVHSSSQALRFEIKLNINWYFKSKEVPAD